MPSGRSYLSQAHSCQIFYPISEFQLPRAPTTEPMRALTLHQPWASLIALTRDHRDPQLGRARVSGRLSRRLSHRHSRRQTQAQARRVERPGGGGALTGMDLPLGVIVATARVDGCVRVLSNGFARLSEPADPGKV